MNLMYKSTRDGKVEVTATEAILKGLADDGGLFVRYENGITEKLTAGEISIKI